MQATAHDSAMNFKPMNQNTNLIFAHVPKCAGSSVVATLLESRNGTTSIQWGRIDESFDQFLKSGKTGHFVYGHLRARHLERLEELGRDCRVITFLRHPVDRLVSVYRYNASPASPNYRDFVLKNPYFEKWVIDYSERFPNDIASFICGKVDSAEEYVEKVLNRFDFIGFQETYRDDVKRLCNVLNIPQAVMRENVTQLTPHNDVNVSTKLRRQIEELNALDMAAYWKLRKQL